MLRRLLGAAGVSLAIVLAAAPAAARRTVVDFDYATQQVLFKTLTGYCDLDGQDCSATKLPYVVDFGGVSYDSIIVYGNGLISFGPSPVDLTNLAQYNGSLSFFGGTVISPLINNSTLEDYAQGGSGLQVFTQDATLSVSGDTIKVNWRFTNSTTSSYVLYSAVLNPESDGLHVAFSYDGLPSPILPGDLPPPNSGYSIAGGPTVEQPTMTDRSFVIPATFRPASAVPEPATWLLLLVGLGAIGGALRRARGRALATC